MICPKCGRPVDENAVICRGCDFILDTEFLGDGILDEEHSLRPGAGGVDAAAFNLADAVILGNIDDDSQSFETSDSGFHMKQNLNARLYVSGRSQALMAPDAVPAIALPVTDGVRLTPFERHVLSFIDGKRPVEVIRRAAGLDEAEVKTALATLADKGVVKVVGRALADFDPAVDPAARRAPQRPRIRGSELGAVALVGDEADQAIEEAFRTSVVLIAPIFAVQPNLGAPDTGDVFHQTRLRDSDLSSDIDQFIGLKGTDEIEKKAASEPSSSTIRPSVMKGAVNRRNRPGEQRLDDAQRVPPPVEVPPVMRALFDEADRIDDVGVPMSSAPGVRPPQSSAPITARPPAPSGVFADLSDSISDVGAGTPSSATPPSTGAISGQPGQPRPSAQPIVPTPVRAVMASAPLSASAELMSSIAAATPWSSLSAPQGQVGRPGEHNPSIEREAASGEVWGNVPGKGGPPKATSSISLSDLLSEMGRQDEDTANVSPERAAAMLLRKEAQRDSDASDEHAAVDDESFEEPTAAGQPMPALLLPLVGSSRPKAINTAGQPAERMGEKRSGNVPSPVAPHPGIPAPAKGGRLSGGIALAEPTASHPGAVSRPAKVESVEGSRGSDAAQSDASDSLAPDFQAPSTGPQQRDPLPTTGVPSSFPGKSLLPAKATAMVSRQVAGQDSVQSIEAASIHDDSRRDETVSPSQAPSEPEESAPSSSVEMLDSALVLRPAIRPAAKAVPLSAAARQARTSRPRERPAPEQLAEERAAPQSEENARPADSLSEGLSSPAVDEDTVNLDAGQVRTAAAGSKGAPPRAVTMMVRGQGGGAASIPSGLSQVIEIGASTLRAPPSEENRQKSSKLFEEAQKEAAAGRMGAARMNAKLASIYDPANDEYRRQLKAWDRPPTKLRTQVSTSAPSSPESRPSDESQAEIKALYDEAQRFEDGDDVDAALSVLEQGIERFPNAAAFHNRLGVILALRKRDYEGAVHAIQLAIDLDPDNLHYKSNLGKIVAKMRGPRPEA